MLRLLPALKRLEPWLSLLPDSEAGRHQEALFRSLYKGVLIAAAGRAGRQAEGVTAQLAVAECLAAGALRRGDVRAAAAIIGGWLKPGERECEYGEPVLLAGFYRAALLLQELRDGGVGEGVSECVRTAAAAAAAEERAGDGGAREEVGPVCCADNFECLWPALGAAFAGRREADPSALLLRGAELRWVASALHSIGQRLTAAARRAPPSSSPRGRQHAPTAAAAARLCALAAAPLRASARAALAAALDACTADGGQQAAAVNAAEKCAALADCLHRAAPARYTNASQRPLVGSASALQAEAAAAAVAPRHGAAGLLRRAALHRAAAEAAKRAGDVAGALHDASEALRLSGSLFGILSDRPAPGAAPAEPPAGAGGAGGAGWWRAAADYLGSLLQAGELAEAAGAPDDAAAALREGQRLACEMGSRLLASLLAARLGEARLWLLLHALVAGGGAPLLARKAAAAAAAAAADAGAPAAAAALLHGSLGASTAWLRAAAVLRADSEWMRGDAAVDLAALEAAGRAHLDACLADVPAGAVCSLSVGRWRGGPAHAGGPLAAGAAGEAAAGVVETLVISRCVQGRPPLVLEVDVASGDAAGAGAAAELAAILGGSADSMRAAATGSADGAASVAPGAAPAQRSAWWRTRLALDTRLRALQERLDVAWLGPWRCLLLGPPADPAMAQALRTASAAAARAALGDASLAPQGGHYLSDNPAWSAGATEALNPGDPNPLEELWWAVACGVGALSHAELLRAVGELLRLGGVPAGAPAADDVAARLRSAHEDARAAGAPLGKSARPARTAAVPDAKFGVDARKAVYLLNPSGDLPATQAAFEAWFAQQPGWQGTAGAPAPPGRELAAALAARQLFVYCGHGAGEACLGARTLRRLPACAAALLMGCSSGRLAPAGAYDPSGPVLSYLLAGSPVAVANLWDVTDRDIDRFARAMLEAWLPLPPPAATPGRAIAIPAASSAVEANPAGPGAVGAWQRQAAVAAAVAAGRLACRLPHLIGAAPVCYGLPADVRW
ncbi:hypothetical protein WJX81_003434 [Elliptochloris bilobata]|uniref:separase n=1 Tax=Elliptochloris bilobata TaxID=381761 RepID=A0AAW1QN26_9CHLO